MAKQNKPVGRPTSTRGLTRPAKAPTPAPQSDRERKLASLAALREKYKGLRASSDDIIREHREEREREEHAG